MDTILNFAGTVLAVLFLFLVLWLIDRRRYRRIGPDEALVVYGRRAKKDKDGFRVIVGGGTFVVPFIEEAEKFPLHAMQLDVQLLGVLAGDARTPINVNGTATVKVPVTPNERAEGFPSVRTAASNFLGLEVNAIRDALTKVVAGHLRTIVAGLSVVELYTDQAKFTEDLKAKAAAELQDLGYVFLSFVFESITDDNGYLDALGVPEIERARRDARIAQADNDRDATLQEEQARLEKEERRITVEESIAEADKGLSLKRAAIKEEVDVAQAKATKAGEIEAKLQDIEIAQREAERQRKELDATVRERAEAEKFAEERKAEAQRFSAEQAASAALYRSEQEAEAERIQRAKAAQAVELEAAADAKRARDVGLAEAEAIQAKGEAEALARQKLAEALRQYTEAGLSIEALKVLPDVIAAASEPLSRAGKTTIISNGNGAGGTGAAKLTRDVTEVLTTTVPVVKDLAGIDLADLLRGALAKATGTEVSDVEEVTDGE
ncbi:MAG: SPFH domain-containing protein [Nitriliruptorales bacterium]|nr:SPFH domain-containing protein [Nitriliruptorales bacterium]